MHFALGATLGLIVGCIAPPANILPFIGTSLIFGELLRRRAKKRELRRFALVMDEAANTATQLLIGE